jgi:hypothetical protein
VADQVTFTLRPEYADGFDGGSTALADGTAYDVKAALDAGGGSIILDAEKDERIITALAGYFPLQHEVAAAARKSKTTRVDSDEQKGEAK